MLQAAALKAAQRSVSMNDKIVVEDVYKIFGSKPEIAKRMIDEGKSKAEIFEQTGHTVGVQEASFTIREGEIFVVMGLSGSGKSTMVRMLNRLIDPTYGTVSIDGQTITRMSRDELIKLRRKDMSMVFQSFALMPHQTVLENAAFGLEVAGYERAARERRALDALEQVGLKANAGSYPSELSGGMKQRVGLARALAVDPSIMLMDEAFSALDPLIRTQMQDELIALQKQRTRTVVFISHDLDEAMRIGDRIAIMEHGRVVQIGQPREIVTNPADDYVQSFFHGVDVTKVFKARDLARQDASLMVRDASEKARSVLERMREGAHDSVVLVDGVDLYRGLATERSLDRAGNGTLDSALVAEAEAAAGDLRLGEVLSRVANAQWDVPVVDEQGRYTGSISKTHLLQVLDRTG